MKLETLTHPVRGHKAWSHYLFRIVTSLVLAIGNAIAMPMHSPVPGGVAIVRVGDDVATPPVVRFNDIQQPVLRQGRHWFALVGLPLDTLRITRQQFIGEMDRRGIAVGIHYPAIHLLTL